MATWPPGERDGELGLDDRSLVLELRREVARVRRRREAPQRDDRRFERIGRERW
jgi:hypothetical protein